MQNYKYSDFVSWTYYRLLTINMMELHEDAVPFP